MVAVTQLRPIDPHAVYLWAAKSNRTNNDGNFRQITPSGCVCLRVLDYKGAVIFIVLNVFFIFVNTILARPIWFYVY